MSRRTRRTHVLPVASEQLKLDLGMPWDGRSPRFLTRVASLFTFQAGTGRPNPGTTGPVLAVQLELFPEGTHYGS